DTRELAARNDVEAAPQAREDIEHRQVRVGLEGVADEVRNAGECLVVLAKGALQRGAGVHEARRAVARGDVGKRDAFDPERAVAIGDRRHSLFSLSSLGVGNSGDVTGAGVVVGDSVGTVPGGVPVGAGADTPGGSRNGPLMPQPASAIALAQAMNTATERRNIRAVMNSSRRSSRSLSRPVGALRCLARASSSA